MSLTGALLAVFVQQWSHSYLRATQERRPPRKRAQIRIFYAKGVDRLHLPLVTRTVPILIHISLSLFFSGFAVFLFSVNLTVFRIVLMWLVLCVVGYACITVMPIFCQDSPYYSPLSALAWLLVTNTIFVVHRLLKRIRPLDFLIFPWPEDRFSRLHISWPSFRSIQLAAEECFLNISPDIDYNALLWMFKVLNDDDEFEQFFDALPSLCASEELGDPRGGFITPNEEELSNALIGMMDRTFMSDLVPEPVKQRRIIICTKVIAGISLLTPWFTLRRVLLGSWHEFSKSIRFGLLVQNWKNNSDSVTAFFAQCMVAVIISSVEERDEHWYQLASDPLIVSSRVLQNTLTQDDSLLLANLIFIVRQTIRTYNESPHRHRNLIIVGASKPLGSLCGFDIRGTLPELQHEFCILWNEIVDLAQNNERLDTVSKMILKKIRRLYIALHEGTSDPPATSFATIHDRDPVLDVATSYPRCRILGAHIPYRFQDCKRMS